MGLFLLLLFPFLASIMQIGSIAFSFMPNYLWATQILNMITIIFIALSGMVLFMLEPVSSILDAKFKHKSIWFILQKNGNIVMKVANSKAGNNDIEGYGTFLDNQYARKVFAGMPAYQIHEDMAVPPETDTITLCSRLENAGIKSLDEWRVNPSKIKYDDLDIKSVKRYFNNLNPNYVNVRIERIAAELSREYRQAWKAILPWISIMLVGLIFAAIAYVIITSVAAPTTAPGAVQTAASTGVIPTIG